MKLSDFENTAKFESSGDPRKHANRILAGGGEYVSRIYRDKATGQLYQVCADAMEYRVGMGEDFGSSPWLPLAP